MKMYAAIWTTISLLATSAFAADCRDLEFDGASFTVCEAQPAADDIRLFLNDAEGDPLGTFDNVETTIAPSLLSWAMNGGMYHSDRRPVGYFVEDGVEKAPLVTRDGPGNFGLLPNGVLCLTATSAAVIESRRFDRARPTCSYATQSGPMLVIEGDLHPRFLEASDSLNVRNGVGVTADGTLVAAISNERVNFHHFGRLFRDALGSPNALFLDGTISRLYAPGLERRDIGFPMGPILGVARAAD
ncbi:MAG: phosphodiester glycosidase family protein [Pseudomonadota bacterium]